MPENRTTNKVHQLSFVLPPIEVKFQDFSTFFLSKYMYIIMCMCVCGGVGGGVNCVCVFLSLCGMRARVRVCGMCVCVKLEALVYDILPSTKVPESDARSVCVEYTVPSGRCYTNSHWDGPKNVRSTVHKNLLSLCRDTRVVGYTTVFSTRVSRGE